MLTRLPCRLESGLETGCYQPKPANKMEALRLLNQDIRAKRLDAFRYLHPLTLDFSERARL